MYNDKILKDRRRELRQDNTKSEDLLWQKIRNRKLSGLKFRRQYSTGSYILDFFCPEIRLAIELDGEQHKDAVEYDKERELFLKDKDIHTIRFWNNEVVEDIARVLKIVEESGRLNQHDQL